MSERECNNPKPSDVLHRCEGASVKVATCDDAQVCNGKSRVTPVEFATQQCAKFSQFIPFIDPKGTGMQAAYSDSKFCITPINRPSRQQVLIIFIFNIRIRTTLAIMCHFLQAKRPRWFLHATFGFEQFA